MNLKINDMGTATPGMKEATIERAVEMLIQRAQNFPRFDWVEQAYAEYMKGKTVALIGGSVSENPVKHEIDADVLIRVNGHISRQGGRCDVLYHTCVANPDIGPGLIPHISRGGQPAFVFLNAVDGDYEVGNKEEPTYFAFIKALREYCPDTNIGFFTQGEWEKENPYGKQYEWLNDLHKGFGAKLFTGLVALGHILRTEAAEVRVYAMDLFVKRTGGKLEGKVESHEIRGNVRFVNWLAKGDQRLKLDEPMKLALEAYGFGEDF